MPFSFQRVKRGAQTSGQFLMSTVRELLKRRAKNNPAVELIDAGLFDPEFYLKSYPDVATAGIDPVQHYLLWGKKKDARHPTSPMRPH